MHDVMYGVYAYDLILQSKLRVYRRLLINSWYLYFTRRCTSRKRQESIIFIIVIRLYVAHADF